MKHLEGTPVTAKKIMLWTSWNVILTKVLSKVLYGWPEVAQEDPLKLFFNWKEELSVQDGCLLRIGRVIVPTQGHSIVLQELHESHPGASRMKALARMFIWWPGLNKEIQTTVKQSGYQDLGIGNIWTISDPLWAKCSLSLPMQQKGVEVEMIEKIIDILRNIFATH